MRAPAAKHVWSHRQRSLIAPSQTREPDCYQCTCISVTAWILHLFKIWNEHSLWITAILCRCRTSRGLMNEGWLLRDKLQGEFSESTRRENYLGVEKLFIWAVQQTGREDTSYSGMSFHSRTEKAQQAKQRHKKGISRWFLLLWQWAEVKKNCWYATEQNLKTGWKWQAFTFWWWIILRF